MTTPLGVEDFFVLEAGEYLERLAHLVATTPAPADELVRFTRALRGSALMARQQPIARAAGGLETLVRAFRDGRRDWDHVTASIAAEAVVEIRALVSCVHQWTDEHTSRADRLATALESEAGGTPGGVSRAARSAPADAGVRAFIAREGAVVASALDQVSRALRSTPDGQDTLQAVLRRMQPLRGLAALADFPPLPELLDGIARVIGDLPRLKLPAQAGGDLFDAAAKAVSRAARDVAEHGRPNAEAPEARQFATLLLATRPPEPAMVPIEALFFEDGLPGIVRRGVAPEPVAAAPLGEAELVSRGEHLCQIADDLEAATSPTQRDLRLHSLTGDLRALSPGTTGELGARLLEFSDVAAGMLEEGLAARISHAFAERLRAVGEALRAASQAEEGDVAERVQEATAGLHRIRSGSVATVPAPVAEPEDDIVPIESLAPDDSVPEPHPASPAELSVDGSRGGSPFAALFAGSGASAESGDLAGSYVTFDRLLRESAVVSPSLDGLMGRLRPAPSRPTAQPAIQPAPQLVPTPAPMPLAAAAFVAAASPVAEPDVPVVEPVVEIAELCYRGRTALQRAAAIKTQIRGALEGSSSQSSLEPLVAELLDLVELALIE